MFLSIFARVSRRKTQIIYLNILTNPSLFHTSHVRHHCFHQNGYLVLVWISTNVEPSSSVRVTNTITPILACFFTINSPVSIVFAYSFHDEDRWYSSSNLIHSHACTSELRWNVSELLAIPSSFLIWENLIDGANIKSFRIDSCIPYCHDWSLLHKFFHKDSLLKSF